MDRSGLKRRAGVLSAALGVTAAVSAFSPFIVARQALGRASLGYAFVVVLSLLAWGLPILTSHALWRIARPGAGSRGFATAFFCYCAYPLVLGAFVLGAWALSSSRLWQIPPIYAALTTATTSVPGLVSLFAMLAVIVGLWRSSLTPRWVALIGIVSVTAFAVLAIPSAYQLYAMLLHPQESFSVVAWMGWLAYCARASGALFWLVLGASLLLAGRVREQYGEQAPV